MKKKLIVIDMQNDFIDGSLGTKEAEAIVENVCRKISMFKSCDIIATRDTHYENYLETMEGKNLPVKHCIKDTYGWQINSDVAEALGNAKIINKPTFGSVELAQFLKDEYEKEPFSLELVGLCTDICVVSNALTIKAFIPEIEISVDSSCCAGVTTDTHNSSLLTMASCQIKIL